MFAGKPVIGVGPYYIPKIDDVVKDLVSKVVGVCRLRGKNLTMDRHYGSVSIANWLLEEQKMTSKCTMRLNRLGLPQEVKNGKDREHLSKTVHY